VQGDLSPAREALVRVHHPVSVLDLLETEATTHSWNISASMAAIQAAECGVMVLLNCNESASELFAQFDALNAPESTATVRAANMDLRSYGIGAQILRALGVGKMTLLASPRKMPSMTGFGLEVVGFQSKPDLK
jgi:3,4-dihydroxy 2-butanone 4-phosphate synthase/GTP cyclohydrolase II